MNHPIRVGALIFVLTSASLQAHGQAISVAAQPLIAQARRVEAALEALGSPLPMRSRKLLEQAVNESDEAKAVQKVQNALDPLCLLAVNINPEARVKVKQGASKAELLANGWRVFLVRVENLAGVTAELKVSSPNAKPLFNSPRSEVRDRWLEMLMFNAQPLTPRLSGLGLEYRIVQLYSSETGQREAKISFNVGQGTQDIGFRNETDILFTSTKASPVTLLIRDENKLPATATFTIRDRLGRVYPSQARRLAPDFAFHPQIYRVDGEKLSLPPGDYTIECTRGPEYLSQTQQVTVGKKPLTLRFALERWVDPSLGGWWSGDHHIHAAGCAHYTNPTEGVHAPDMARQCRGEDLKVGCNLTWGPCFDYQKQFFTGKIDPVSNYPYLLRYDIEVSGFGSHQSGHLCLLRLKDQMYPGGDSSKHWPTLCLNTLRWAKKQGAVCGPAHSGIGLGTKSNELPTFEVPPFNGIGAIEYIVDVTHTVPGPDGTLVPAVDFMSTVDTPFQSELNIWYHTLNCGYRTRISGETDFPCITGERVGKGRSYVKLDGKLDFDTWCEGIRKGRCYVSDGRSHLMDFAVNGQGVGDKESEIRLSKAGMVHATLKVAGLLPEIPDNNAKQGWYWNLERARIGTSREVTVEIIQNGYPVAQKKIVADGKTQDITFDVEISRSSWVAARILGSSHTNPVFIIVGEKPIRAFRRSAEWCLKSVDVCWAEKKQFIAPAEMEDAKQAYQHAREAYRKILAECEWE